MIWDWHKGDSLENGKGINYTGWWKDCDRRREEGWIAEDEECSTGNYTEYLVDDWRSWYVFGL